MTSKGIFKIARLNDALLVLLIVVACGLGLNISLYSILGKPEARAAVVDYELSHEVGAMLISHPLVESCIVAVDQTDDPADATIHYTLGMNGHWQDDQWVFEHYEGEMPLASYIYGRDNGVPSVVIGNLMILIADSPWRYAEIRWRQDKSEYRYRGDEDAQADLLRALGLAGAP